MEHIKMAQKDRAKQFLPYKAVQGLEEAIEQCDLLYQEAVLAETKKRQDFRLPFSRTNCLKRR